MGTRRKRSHADRRHAESSKGHGLAWFLAGAVAGGLVIWVVLGRDPAAEQVRATVERTVGHPIGVEPAAPPPKPKFEFYTLLPEMEVVIPDEDLAASRPAPAESESTDEVGTADDEGSAREDDGQGTAETPPKIGRASCRERV